MLIYRVTSFFKYFLILLIPNGSIYFHSINFIFRVEKAALDIRFHCFELYNWHDNFILGPMLPIGVNFTLLRRSLSGASFFFCLDQYFLSWKYQSCRRNEPSVFTVVSRAINKFTFVLLSIILLHTHITFKFWIKNKNECNMSYFWIYVIYVLELIEFS